MHMFDSIQTKREDLNWESFCNCAGHPAVSHERRASQNHDCSLVELTDQSHGLQHAINFFEAKTKSKDKNMFQIPSELIMYISQSDLGK